MKNKIENRNTFKATFLRPTAILISIFLLSLTVNAKGFWNNIFTNNSSNEITAVLVENTSTEKEVIPTSLVSNSEVSISLSIHEAIEEETLETEDWMFDNSYFQSVEMEQSNEMEQPLELEQWMQDENYFNNDIEVEEKLQLESWMTTENYWV